MAKSKTRCPRCNSPNARPNARGPNVVFCGRCGGLVPLDYQDEGPYSDNPVQSVLAREAGIDRIGRVIERRIGLKGGL